MNTQRIADCKATPIIFSILYTIYFYLMTKFLTEQNKWISINSITTGNVATRFIGDFLVMLLIPLILIIIFRKRLSDFKLTLLNTYLQYILIAVYMVLFILHGDFTVNGFYKFFFYLVIIAFGEEFIYRGYVYNTVKRYNRVMAIFISGFFFGIMHAMLPGILAGFSITQIGISMLGEIGFGIIGGYYFIYLLERSKSLFIPIFVHAILNYSIGGIGILTALGTGIYLFINSRKEYTN